MYGAIQPDRLAEFKDLDSDGLVQRMCIVRVAAAEISRPNIKVQHKLAIENALRDLATTDTLMYTTKAGELIRETEAYGTRLSGLSDLGVGFRGFCSKLHGLHARLALIVHMLEDPHTDAIPASTIMRAGRLLRDYLLPQALGFYQGLAGSSLKRTQEIAGWVLTKARDRFVASDLKAGVWCCRDLSTKQMADALDPLVTGGWLIPEEPYPSNRAWAVVPGLRKVFEERAAIERQRRADIRDEIAKIATGKAA